MGLDWIPVKFIGEEIEAFFDRPPMLSKKPGPPEAFFWRGEKFAILEVMVTWFDYRRRGDMAKNMTPAHIKTASRRGSRGVGRFYFRVLSEDDRVFDIYYDRAPKDAGDRAGHWFLWRELRLAMTN